MRTIRFSFYWVLAAALGLQVADLAAPVLAQETQTQPADQTEEETIEDLEQRIRILERLREIEAEQEAEKAKNTVTATAGKEGFSIQSAGGNFILKFRGLVQFDGGFFQGDEVGTATDTFQITRARPIIEGTVYKIYDFRITPDFGLGKTVLQDAYMDARFHPAAKMRAGKFKTPFGLERLQSAADLLFVARALPNNLVPNRDEGLEIYGDFQEGAIGYAAGIFNGVPDGGSVDSDIDDSKIGAARVFAHPFKKTSLTGLSGLGIGVASTLGNNRGKPTATGLGSYKTAGQQTFFSYLSGSPPTTVNTVVADGRSYRISPQLYYYMKRFGLMAEWVSSSQEVQIDTAEATIQNESWQVSAEFFLTDDTAAYKRVAPKKPFEPSAGTIGAIELVARYGRLNIDEDAFPVFANPAVSASEATEKGAGVSWDLNRNFRLMLDYSWTSFVGGAASGNRDDEKVLLSRFQIAF